MGWVFAWLQADSNAAAGYRSHCVRCTVVDWFNCEWRVTERFVKMPRTFTHEEYADMVYVYGYCNGNANAAVDEYRRRYPLRRTPNRAVFTSVFCALRECGTLPSVHVSSERRSIQTVEEQEEIVSMVQRSPTTSTRRIALRLRVPQSRVWRTLHDECLYPLHHQPAQHLHPGDDAQRLNFVIGYTITGSYCRTFYLQIRPHLLVMVLIIPATLIIGRRITLMLPVKQISKHGSP